MESLLSSARPRPSHAGHRETDTDAPGRLNGRGPIAVIDIGSNSVRLVVYERLSRSPATLFNEKALCGLGRGLAATGMLDAGAVASALGSIRRFCMLLSQMRVRSVYVFATAAVREASNGPEFITTVEGMTRTSVAVLSGHEEARLSALGVVSGIDRPEGVAGDLGGGSLELVEVTGPLIGNGETFPLGGLRLEETSGGVMAKAEEIAKKALAGSNAMKSGKGMAFYAIGGTWRSLARLHMGQTGYPLRVMHHYAIPSAEAADFCKMVARQDVETLESIEVVSKNRRPLLPYGAAVLGEVIAAMKPSQIVMSALGVREGHLYDLLTPEEQAQDPLIAACDELGLLRSRSPEHARELGPWTDRVFDALGISETPNERRLRHAACLLADTGWRAHPDYRGEQSLNMIAHAAFFGVDHPGRAYLALAIYYRHQGLGSDPTSERLREIVTPRLLERARALGATIRLAHMVSAAMPGVIQRTRLDRRGKMLTLVLPKDIEPLNGERLVRRLGQLAKLVSAESTVLIEG